MLIFKQQSRTTQKNTNNNNQSEKKGKEKKRGEGEAKKKNQEPKTASEYCFNGALPTEPFKKNEKTILKFQKERKRIKNQDRAREIYVSVKKKRKKKKKNEKN